MNSLEVLKKAILDLHGCDSERVLSVPVHETYQGKVVWDGDVEVFLLIDHPPAKRAYAWSKDEFGETLHVVILGIPPINSPVDAVRAAIIEEARQKIPRGKAAFETGVD